MKVCLSRLRPGRFGQSGDRAYLSYPSSEEDDLPRHVTGRELGVRRSNIVERVGALARHDEIARGYRVGQFGQGRRARAATRDGARWPER